MKSVTLSYAVTACNEDKELDRLLSQLSNYAGQDDEVIVQVDSDSVTQSVLDVIEKYKKEFANDRLTFVSFPLNKNFANFKNNLKENCKKDYIFFIDADEYLSIPLVQHLRNILTDNRIMECIHVPRVNTVEGLTKEHIAKWRWNVNKKGYINWPDYQTRICKNEAKIKWEGKVHEKICGCQVYTYLPDIDETWALYHPKDIKRQEKQNNFYQNI
jgi:glycosyltransferase involved in cell wall biosynthesis